MKTIFFFPMLLFFAAGIIILSCKKEHANPTTPIILNLPVAKAESNPKMIDSAVTEYLDGRNSYVPGNRITNYLWSKISGPLSSKILSPASAYTQVTELVEGVYQFELKVTDESGLVSRDTTQVTVNPDQFGHSEIIVNNLAWQLWNPAYLAENDSMDVEIYLTIPANIIQTLPANNFSVWVKKDSLSQWEAVFNEYYYYAEPFWYQPEADSSLYVGVNHIQNWIWYLPSRKASVKIRF